MAEKKGLYILLISVHGLVRGDNIELGRDADTGGQIRYVVDLTRSLSLHPAVERVDLVTRQVIDSKVSGDYASEEELLSDNSRIIRLPCGPRRYLRKEALWPHLDSLFDSTVQYLRRVGKVPDVIHSHYADAGYVGRKLAALLGVPLVHTGHSLGRVKKERLVESGLAEAQIEKQYKITQRIEAEEAVFDSASFVIASTHQEVDEQYRLYDNYHPSNMVVIPPGFDLDNFSPVVGRKKYEPPILDKIKPFLADVNKPIVLALSRPDFRKNIGTLVKAYAEHSILKEKANLVILAGQRDDIQALDKGARRVLTELIYLIDLYDLYGKVAYPKHHEPSDVPDLYRLAARSKGVFVNPALTEPFGLTLIEAAASGLPIVATEDGGPREIISFCKNGLLVDPLDPIAMGDKIYSVLTDVNLWKKRAKLGISGASRYFSWAGHVDLYLKRLQKVINRTHRRKKTSSRSRLPIVEKVLICDVDHTLTGDQASLNDLLEVLRDKSDSVGFGVVTGRSIESVKRELKRWNIPLPDLLITSVGSEVFYGPNIISDSAWARHIEYRWCPEAVRARLKKIPGLKSQRKEEQRIHKISYTVDQSSAPELNEIAKYLRQHDLHVNLVYSHQCYLDVLPVRASKGAAVRYFLSKWDIDVESVLVVGDSGSDEDMLCGNTLGVVVGNYSQEVERLKGRENIYFSPYNNAAGVMDGIKHYDFL